jgi:hypothetical protein
MTEEKSNDQYIQEFVDYIATRKETTYDLYVQTNKLPEGYWKLITNPLHSKGIINIGTDKKCRPTPITKDYINGKYLESVEAEKITEETSKIRIEKQDTKLDLDIEFTKIKRKVYCPLLIISVTATLIAIISGGMTIYSKFQQDNLIDSIQSINRRIDILYQKEKDDSTRILTNENQIKTLTTQTLTIDTTNESNKK